MTKVNKLSTDVFFDSLRFWFKDMEHSETWSLVQYTNGRICGMIDVAVDTGVISINTWTILYRMLNAKIDDIIKRGGIEITADIIIDDMKADVEMNMATLHDLCRKKETMRAYKELRTLLRTIIAIAAETHDFDYFMIRYEKIIEIMQKTGMYENIGKLNELYDNMKGVIPEE